MKNEAKAAVIGALAATLVVAISMAPRLGGPPEVSVRNASTEAAPLPDDGSVVDEPTTTTTEAAATVEGDAPTSTTTTTASTTEPTDTTTTTTTTTTEPTATTTTTTVPPGQLTGASIRPLYDEEHRHQTGETFLEITMTSDGHVPPVEVTVRIITAPGSPGNNASGETTDQYYDVTYHLPAFDGELIHQVGTLQWVDRVEILAYGIRSDEHPTPGGG